MIIRAYISNIASGWSIQQQKELMAAHVPGWPDVPTYVDVLSPAKRKAHSPASLANRIELLRQTSRPDNAEVIIVTSLACLAWEQSDFLQCVAAASTRGATLVAIDTGRQTAPDASPTEIADAVQEFVSRRRSKRGLGPPGHLVSADRRAAEARAGAMRIKERWALPTKDYPTDPLLAEAGICRNTANLYLGKRPDAQRKHRNALDQAERNRKRRTRIEQMTALQEQAA